MEMVPPPKTAPTDPWKVKFAWQGGGVALPDTPLQPEQITDRSIELNIPFDSGTTLTDGAFKPATPGIRGRLRFLVEGWNT